MMNLNKALNTLENHKKLSNPGLVLSHGNVLVDATKLMTQFLEDNSMKRHKYLGFDIEVKLASDLYNISNNVQDHLVMHTSTLVAVWMVAS